MSLLEYSECTIRCSSRFTSAWKPSVCFAGSLTAVSVMNGVLRIRGGPRGPAARLSRCATARDQWGSWAGISRLRAPAAADKKRGRCRSSAIQNPVALKPKGVVRRAAIDCNDRLRLRELNLVRGEDGTRRIGQDKRDAVRRGRHR